jgi:polysaccharide pyruvyl transferase WcaK-like protein
MAKILILGGDADANVGDAGILAATCQRFADADRRVAITIVSRRRRIGELPGLAGVIAPGPRDFPALLALARRQDLIVFGGGGLLQDDDSRIKVPYWAARLSALKSMQRNIVGLSLGVGPLEHAESRMCARWICDLLGSVSVRDDAARSWLQPCSKQPVLVVPDPAFMLRPAPPAAAEELLRSLGLPADRPLLGVTMRGWFHRRGGFVPHAVRARLGLGRDYGATARARLAASLAAEVRRVARRLDAAVLLMPSYGRVHEGDLQACEALTANLDGVLTATARIDDPALYKAVAGRLSLMISARMHPLIFAASMGVPVVGLAYNDKFNGVFQLLGRPDQLLELQNWSAELREGWLEPAVQAALGSGDGLPAQCALLAQRVSDYTASLLDRLPA